MHNNTRHLEILEVAATLFFKQGFTSTKIMDIAKNGGWSKGLVYFYYKNKEDLYLAVLERALELNLQLLESAMEKGGEHSGLEDALSLLDQFLSMSVKTRHFQEIIIQAMQLTESAKDPDIAGKMGLSVQIFDHPKLKEIRATQRRIYEIVKDTIERGQADGSIGNMAPASMIYLSIWSFIVGFETMVPVMESHQVSTLRPKHDYLLVPLGQWKSMILLITRNTLLTKGV